MTETPSTQTDQQAQEKLLVIDGHSLAFRAYFALPVESFTNSEGQPTNAVYGFFTMLSDVITKERPTHLAVAFDVKGGTFRNQLLGQYKGTREAAPQELLSQLPLIQQALKDLGVTYIEKPGFEGDDIIGTLASMGEQHGDHVLVLSGDRDAFQLIDNAITVLYPGHHFKDLKHMTPDAVFEKYGVTPQQYPDLAALRGENADNIPGVPGVGDGFAAKWIKQFGSLEGIIEHADEIGGKKGAALRENIDQVKLNRKVNALVRDLDLGVTVDDLTFGDVNMPEVQALFKSLNFGARTKKKILDAFADANAMSAMNAGASVAEADEVKEPTIDTVTSPEQLQQWAHQYLPAVQPEDTSDAAQVSNDAAQASDDASQQDSSAQTSDDAANLDVLAQLKAQSNTCVAAVDASWTFYVAGNAKPGASSADTFVLLAHDHAVSVDAHNSAMVDALKQIVASHANTACVFDLKATMHMCHAAGIELPMPLFDAKLAAYLVDPEFPDKQIKDKSKVIDTYAEHFLRIALPEVEEEAQGTLGFDDEVPTSDNKALAMQAALIAAMSRSLAQDVEHREQYALLRCLEMPVSVVLYRMELEGASVDLARLEQLRETFAEEAGSMQRAAWDAAGMEFNLSSPKKIGKVLFEDMGLTPLRKTKSGNYTTNAATLQALYASAEEGTPEFTFLGSLLRFREVTKLQQIVQTLIDSINKHDGRIHTTFEQTVAATGRLSSTDPNLQNIPNRNAEGREIRSAFVPASDFVSLLSADYSQVELRLMADFSGDEALIEAFRSGADFHRYVASLVYGIPVDDITSDQRSHVKAMSYGLAYGLSSYGLSQQLGITPREAEGLKQQYFNTFGKVHDYLESLVATAKQRGYTETMFGRRRYFPALHSPNRMVREAAERAALNAPIQGSAADIMKMAMIRAERALRSAGLRSQIVLQIHDELVVQLAPGETEEATALVKDAMENAVHLAVPLDVSTGIGTDWQLAQH
ncbi:DNA polymerase I [Bifidobacterium dolichotidis]|nr:DNA polymerase I [Bifidobacterium dolichotidis]